MKHLLYLIVGLVLSILLMTEQIQKWINFSTVEGEIVLCIFGLGVFILNIRPTFMWIEKKLNPKTW